MKTDKQEFPFLKIDDEIQMYSIGHEKIPYISYFSHFNESGSLYCFQEGYNSKNIKEQGFFIETISCESFDILNVDALKLLEIQKMKEPYFDDLESLKTELYNNEEEYRKYENDMYKFKELNKIYRTKSITNTPTKISDLV